MHTPSYLRDLPAPGELSMALLATDSVERAGVLSATSSIWRQGVDSWGRTQPRPLQHEAPQQHEAVHATWGCCTCHLHTTCTPSTGQLSAKQQSDTRSELVVLEQSALWSISWKGLAVLMWMQCCCVQSNTARQLG